MHGWWEMVLHFMHVAGGRWFSCLQKPRICKAQGHKCRSRSYFMNREYVVSANVESTNVGVSQFIIFMGTDMRCEC